MVKDILTPMNHREIEYNAKYLSGIKCPDSFNIEQLSIIQSWLEETGDKVFDDDLVMDYGTDCLRLYLMFENTPKENDAPFYESWNEGALEGMYKFLGKYRRLVMVAGECDLVCTDKSIETLDSALKDTYAKINKYLNRGNKVPNRHNIISALMELLNLYQKELKIGEVITALHNHEIEMAVPLHEHTLNNEQKAKPLNPEVTRLCKELIGIMSPFAPDMSKTLLQSFIVSEK
jgi:methionyl-tRNA synthetase